MDPCSICQEDGILHSTPCNHAFHQECLDRWFEQQRITHRSPNCPICRRDIAPVANPFNIQNAVSHGDSNVVIGRSEVVRDSNVAVGYNTIPIYNTAVSYDALSANVPGYYNHPGSNQLESWNGVI
jgi:hypothetical protein